MWWLLYSLAAGISLYFFYRRQQRRKRVAELEEIVRRKQKQREESIEWAIRQANTLSEEERRQISRLDYNTLKGHLREGKVTASDVLCTYLGLAIKAHERTNCATIFIKESVEWAAEWDRRAKEDKALEKPALFGIPFSIKECVSMKGYDRTRGYVVGAFHPSDVDNPIVQQLKLLGGIPFVQTNVPMSMVSFTCGNSLYGWTSNPHRSDRTPGGSSGGESALIAAGGSVIGIGSDLGGSIRMPAHFTGIAGFKPSHTRISQRGVQSGIAGRPLLEGSEGPMAASIHTCIDFLREMWSIEWQSELDPYVPPVTWRAAQFEEGKKYRIGYYVNDGWFKATPGCERVVEEAKQLLEEKGHKVVPFSPPDIPTGFSLVVGAGTLDGGAYFLSRIEQDLAPPEFLRGFFLMRLPLLVQRAAAKIALLLGYPRIHRFMTSTPLNTSELRERYEAIEKYRHRFVEAMQNENIDVILCPAQVMPAPPHEGPLYLTCAINYTAIFNLLDFGAGVVKGGEWTDEDEQALNDYPEGDIWYKKVKELSKDSVGLPLGVQLAGPPFHEESVLRTLADLEDAVRERDTMEERF